MSLRKGLSDGLHDRAAGRLDARRAAMGGSTTGPALAGTTSAKDKAAKAGKDTEGAAPKVSLKKEPPPRVSLRKAAAESADTWAQDRLRKRRSDPGPPVVGRDPQAEQRRQERAEKKERRRAETKAAGQSADGADEHDQDDEKVREFFAWHRSTWWKSSRSYPRDPDPGGAGAPGAASGRAPGGSGRGPGDIPDPYTVTVTRDDPPPRPAPAGIGPGIRGLPRAPYRTPHTRPGTTAPISMPGTSPAHTSKETPMAKTTAAAVPRPAVRLPGVGGRQMAAEHETEVTLDQVLDRLTTSRDGCLDTYDQCEEMARRAVELRDALAELSDDLAERHNIIGSLTSSAMASMAESMDLLAAQAHMMRTRSLTAAEELEAAHDGMHDAYRPVQQATADAGLATPSARAHNED